MDYLAKNHTPDVFVGIFSDLVAIPSLRPFVLAMVRMENRSNELSIAIGQLFKSDN